MVTRKWSLLRGGLLICCLATSPASAQVAGEDLNGAPQVPPAQSQQHAQAHRFVDRFRAANTAGDGRLTLAQAQAGDLPMIARHFDAIDTQHKGYVTLQDIRAYRQQMGATREGAEPTAN